MNQCCICLIEQEDNLVICYGKLFCSICAPFVENPCFSVSRITDTLFVGNQEAANEKSFLEGHKIFKIIVAGSELDLPHKNDNRFSYHQISIKDTIKEDIRKHFDEVYQFIEQNEHKENQCQVLIHCKAGISRSATIAVAYLMKKFHLNYREAYQKVKYKRPIINPNIGFYQQLMQYEKDLCIPTDK